MKSFTCAGPGAIATPGNNGYNYLNNRVPVKDGGFTDGGYNEAQREFIHAFPDYKRRVFPSPARHMRFVQCAYENSPRRYSVGWNGMIQEFQLSRTIPCQGISWHLINRILGECPSGG